MSLLSAKLRNATDNALIFWCPGCDEPHKIHYGDGRGPRWTWNGDAERPTFSPSVLVTSGHYLDSHQQGDDCWCTFKEKHPDRPVHAKCYRCHSFVTDGRIQFLSDCTHALAGKAVDMPEWPR